MWLSPCYDDNDSRNDIYEVKMTRVMVLIGKRASDEMVITW